MLPVIGYIVITYVAWKIFSKILEAKNGEQTWLGAFALIAIAYFAFTLAMTADDTAKKLRQIDAATSSLPLP
jgi:hypothetical protein